MADLLEWFSVRFDETTITLRIDSEGSGARETRIAWERIIRVCFQAGDWIEPDMIYIFTDERPESYAVPMEADGAQALWLEILDRKLFDAEMAIAAASSINELFCYTVPGQQTEIP